MKKKKANLEATPALGEIVKKLAPTVATIVAPIVAEKIGPKVIGGNPAVGSRRRDLGIIVIRDLVPTLIDLYQGSQISDLKST